MSFKENLKTELKYQDILVKELAAMVGMSKKTLDNYLNSRRYIPSAEAAVKIAKALGVSVEYLVTGEEISPSKSSLGSEIQDLIQNFKLLSEDDRKIIVTLIGLLRNRGTQKNNNA